MKIKDLRPLIEELNPNSEIAVFVKRNTDAASIITYDVDYFLNEYGELVFSVADFDGEKWCLHESV
jgi:hypothetical protein